MNATVSSPQLDLDEEVAVDAVIATPNDTGALPPDDLDELFADTSETDTDPFAELDGMISEGLHAKAEARAVANARDRLKRGNASALERAEDAARIRAWEAKHEWNSEANVALFTQWACACGALKTVFTGLFERQGHKHMRTVKRWLPADNALTALPNETALAKRTTAMCYDCAPARGWDLGKAYEWKVEV